MHGQKPPQKKHLKIILISILLLLLLIFSGSCYIIYAGFNLQYSSVLPPNIDVVVTYASHPSRYKYSREIRNKFDSHWIINDPNHMSFRRGVLAGQDLKNSTVLISGYSTYHETIETRKALTFFRMNKENHNRLITVALVSSPFHMRRIRIVANRYLENENHKLVYLPVPQASYENYFPKTKNTEWWKHAILRKEAVLNLVYFFYLYKVYAPFEKMVGAFRYKKLTSPDRID